MDYFDDLDQTALNAFGELSTGSAMDHTSYATSLSPELTALLRKSTSQEARNAVPKRTSSRKEYLFKLSNTVSLEMLCCAAILSLQPKIVLGEGENGVAQFCQVNEHDLCKLKGWLAHAHPGFRPVIAPINKAYKEFSACSAYPTLGLDTTLPQHRPTERATFMPAQELYPVWYFVYGTLADPVFLAQLLRLPDGHVLDLLPASICNGKIRTWARKYNALVDSYGGKVQGWACKIMSEEQEDALRMYETAKYEVVRVDIRIEKEGGGNRLIKGCTFRFAGEERELD